MVKKQQQNKSLKTYQLFLSGLPYESTQQDIKQFIGSQQGIIYIKIPRYQDTNRCRGYAHIRFNNQQSYNNVLSKNKSNMLNRYITIQPAKGEKIYNNAPNIPVGCKNLFVKGLPYEINQNQIIKEFQSCGIIEDVRMVRNSVNKKFKGFAYIDFKDNSSLKKAIKKYHNKEYKGRKLICDASITGMKKGYKKRNPNVEYTEQNQQYS